MLTDLSDYQSFSDNHTCVIGSQVCLADYHSFFQMTILLMEAHRSDYHSFSHDHICVGGSHVCLADRHSFSDDQTAKHFGWTGCCAG